MNSPSLISKLMFLTAVKVGRPRSSVYVLTKLLIFTDPSSFGFIFLVLRFRARCSFVRGLASLLAGTETNRASTLV